ncbi:MAG: hypothetical protein JZU63_12940, partial [Rhodoferax sp.]|nr:hypothetical protein [Rhodoferax sp.]
LLWPALYHEALALVSAGEPQAAANRLRFLFEPALPGLPEATAELRQRAVKLAKDFNLPV